ncbi:PD-(D/E)XK nuclease family protein [Demequina sp.]|uniref:PD-(D/E)XK nuclease family protein n=1 Tax=Demequina sp. TaxID=2050685 RepID=UPI003D1488A3
MTLTLDDSQRAVLAALGRANVVATGGPGTGKTSLAVEAVVSAVDRGTPPERVMLLAPTRVAAAALRDRVSLAVNRPTGVALARTPAALAFSILATSAAAEDAPAPSLISGAEQDVVIRDLLAGHRAGLSTGPNWTGIVAPESLELAGFRDELRNLMMRAAEADLQPDDLAALGRRAGRAEWVAGADFYREYLDVLQLRTGPADAGARFDPAVIVSRAADELHSRLERGEPSPWDLLVVDDFHDVTAATAALVGVIAGAGTRVLLLGNADQCVEGFRGALPHALANAVDALGAAHVELTHGYRQGGSLAAVTASLAARISVAGLGSARASGRPDAVAGAGADGSIEVLTSPHDFSQSRAIASRLRARRHGTRPVPWGSMVVIARSRALLRDIRSDLLAADIPCESLGDGVALHREPAVAPLLAIIKVALGQEWTQDSAEAVLGSRLVGLDPVGLRRLRRELLREERAGGGERASTELLLEALSDPASLANVRGAEGRAAWRVAKAVGEARRRAGAPAPTPGAVIWAVWDALDVAADLRASALAGSARDDADLDAVIALLRAAQSFTERLPSGTVASFIDSLEAQEFAADVLGARGQALDAVAFATPASAVGREWDFVVIAGLDEGVWPNLRLRDSVLGSQRLAEALAAGPSAAVERATGQRDLRQARKEVLDDETRALYVAVSRARSGLLVTCVSDGERRPSRFVHAIAGAAGVPVVDAMTVPLVADLRSVVAKLRASGAGDSSGPENSVGQAATALARLAALGEATANPATWYGVAEPSTLDGLFDDGEVKVSPSRYDLVRRCPLRWALETVGGTKEASEAQNTGLLVHALAERLPHGTESQLLAAFDEEWGAPPVTLPDRTHYDKTRRMVVKLAGYIGERHGVQVSVEQPFRVHLEEDQITVSGIADRVEVRDGIATIVDLKTGTAISAADAQDNGQLKLYQLAAGHGGFAGIDAAAGASLVYVGGTTVSASVRTQSAIDADAVLAELQGVAGVMRGATFEACINDRCSSCPVLRSCPAHSEGAQVAE